MVTQGEQALRVLALACGLPLTPRHLALAADLSPVQVERAVARLREERGTFRAGRGSLIAEGLTFSTRLRNGEMVGDLDNFGLILVVVREQGERP